MLPNFYPPFSLSSIEGKGGEGKSDNFRESGKGKFRHSRKKPEEEKEEEIEKENSFDRMPKEHTYKKGKWKKESFHWKGIFFTKILKQALKPLRAQLCSLIRALFLSCFHRPNNNSNHLLIYTAIPPLSSFLLPSGNDGKRRRREGKGRRRKKAAARAFG